MDNEEKKQQGWWAKSVKELDNRSTRLEQYLVELHAMLAKDKKLKELLSHPAIVEFDNHDNRMRKIEQMLINVSRELSTLRNEVRNLDRRVNSVEQRRTRGA